MKSQAEEKNNKDGKNKETVWRVRGSPLLKTSTKTYRLYVWLIVVVIPRLAQAIGQSPVFVNIFKSNNYYTNYTIAW